MFNTWLQNLIMISNTTHFLLYCTATLHSKKRTLPSARAMQMVPPWCTRQAPVKCCGITSLEQNNCQCKKQFYKTNGYIFAFSNYFMTWGTTSQDTELFNKVYSKAKAVCRRSMLVTAGRCVWCNVVTSLMGEHQKRSQIQSLPAF